MHIFIEEDLIDHKFIEDRTENFEAMKEMVKDYTPEKVAEICQIDAEMCIRDRFQPIQSQKEKLHGS